jgi:hypothetical protein
MYSLRNKKTGELIRVDIENTSDYVIYISCMARRYFGKG